MTGSEGIGRGGNSEYGEDRGAGFVWTRTGAIRSSRVSGTALPIKTCSMQPMSV